MHVNTIKLIETELMEKSPEIKQILAGQRVEDKWPAVKRIKVPDAKKNSCQHRRSASVRIASQCVPSTSRCSLAETPSRKTVQVADFHHECLGTSLPEGKRDANQRDSSQRVPSDTCGGMSGI